MRSASSVTSCSQRATPYPCVGPQDNALSTSTSSVPWSSSTVSVSDAMIHHLERAHVPDGRRARPIERHGEEKTSPIECQGGRPRHPAGDLWRPAGGMRDSWWLD